MISQNHLSAMVRNNVTSLETDLCTIVARSLSAFSTPSARWWWWGAGEARARASASSRAATARSCSRNCGAQLPAAVAQAPLRRARRSDVWRRHNDPRPPAVPLQPRRT